MKDASLSGTVVDDDPPFWTKTACLQLGYGLWVNLTVIGIGLAFGWPAVSMPQLLEKNSTMHTTLDDQAWIASVLTLFSPIGSVIGGYLMDRYGRRFILIFCEVPISAGWIYTAFAKTPLHIIVGRIITGIGIGFAISVPRAYITEISLPNMRGVVGAIPNISVALGIMIQAALGSYLRWNVICIISGFYSIILLLTYLLIPETPYYVLMTSNTDNAKIALRKFRSDSFNIEQEVDELNDFKETNDIRRLSFFQQLNELLKGSSCKPFGIGLSYIILMHASGTNVITMWGVEMLERSNVSINAHFGNFILAATRVLFGFITAVLLYKVGRRVLALSSAIGVGMVSITFATYLHLYTNEAIYPLILLIGYMAFATLGYYTLPMLILFELLPLHVRGFLGGIVVSIMNLLIFSTNFCYPYMRDYLGLHNTMGIFGIISLLGALLLYFILPETKGLTLQEIEEYFNATRPSLISSRQYIRTQYMSSFLDLTKISSYERKKNRNKKLQKLQEHDKKTETEDDDGKLKTIYDAKQSRIMMKRSKDSIHPKKGVVFKEPSESQI